MTFFERYFQALDGPDPHSSLALVADNVEFAIEWANGEDRKATQIRGGKAELRAFVDAGDRDAWAHHVTWSATDGDTEFALGETRWEDGRFIGTFLAVAHLDADGRMDRYLVGRSPAISFPSRQHAR
jgi:ketosteroid isomerase-like protein